MTLLSLNDPGLWPLGIKYSHGFRISWAFHSPKEVTYTFWSKERIQVDVPYSTAVPLRPCASLDERLVCFYRRGASKQLPTASASSSSSYTNIKQISSAFVCQCVNLISVVLGEEDSESRLPPSRSFSRASWPSKVKDQSRVSA